MWRDRDRYPEHNYVPDTFWLLVPATWPISHTSPHAANSRAATSNQKVSGT